MSRISNAIALLKGMEATISEARSATSRAAFDAVNILKVVTLAIEKDLPADIFLEEYRKSVFRGIGRPDLIKAHTSEG